ncbi:MAG: carboxypeptidase-like regulatory domain-containing protein [Thermodesulfovibrionales bacterium]
MEDIADLKDKDRKMKIALTILLIIFSLSSCSYAGMSGPVIDAETGKPIEGAIVLVEWTMTKGIGLTHTDSYKVVEKVTDKSGKFSISGVINPLADSPHITIYKKGYVAWNNEYIFPDYKKREDFKWVNGYVFRLERFKEGYLYDKHVSFINMTIRSTIAYEKKKKLIEAFDWETELARREVQQGR